MMKLSALGLFALSACIETPEPPSGRKAFLSSCASCHGFDAKGTGEMADVLFKMPPDLTTLSARNGGVFPRDYVMSTIDGLSRAPHFSGAMPEFGAGDMGDTVIVEKDGLGTPVPAVLLALTEYLEGVQE